MVTQSGRESRRIYLTVIRHARVFDKKSRQLEGSTSNLIRCFVRVEDKLKNAEIEKLGQTPMFLAAPSDSGTKAKRYRAKDLYEPSSENITLGLPVLAWPEPVWDSKSPEARFMFRLGLIEVGVFRRFFKTTHCFAYIPYTTN